MKESPIITVPNLILKEKTAKVSNFDSVLKTQISQMIKALRAEGGVGLAANQLGYKNQVITIEFEEPGVGKRSKEERIPLTIFVNPEIVEYSDDKACIEEGCLSVPKIELEVTRPTKLKIKYQDEHGHKLKIAPRGLLARILQHEIDHLNGIIFTERARAEFFQKYPEFNNLKIAYFGSGEFGAIILEGLILLGLNPEIYTEASKPAGREQKNKPTAVALVAKKYGKEFFEKPILAEGMPLSERRSSPAEGGTSRLVREAGANGATRGDDIYDLLICADFGQKISKSILDQAKIAAINLHPSLLPKYIGPTPIQTAILNEDKTTGVSIIKMTEKIDEGPIYSQVETDISEDDNFLSLRDRLATLGLKLLVTTLPKIVRNELEIVEQDLSKAIKTFKFSKRDGEIDWNKNPKKILAQIRAFYPWPGSFTFVDGKRLIIHTAHLEKHKLVLDLVQLEGKNPNGFKEFIRGYKGLKPEWFEKIKF